MATSIDPVKSEGMYALKVKAADGREVSMSEYRDKVLLIVNTASNCMYTNQYEGLQDLYSKYRDRGFEVLAFPCNQFIGQEPNSDSEIQAFCSLNYSVSFPVFSKVDVNGKEALPLFKHLKSVAPGIFGIKGIKWNFTKFLVDTKGKAVKRFAPKVEPDELVSAIEACLSGDPK